MRKTCFLTLLIAALVINAAPAADNEPTNRGPSAPGAGKNEESSLKLKKTKEARTSVRNFLSRRSSKAQIDPVSNEQVNVLIEGLSDSSAAVRIEALRGLSLIASANTPAGRPPSPGLPDLAGFPAARDALLKLTSDSNPEIRAAAIDTYARTFPVTPELEARWLALFNEDPSEDRKQEIIKGLLSSRNPSKRVVDFAVEQLKNPKLAYSTTLTLLARIKPPPPEALAIIVAEFSRSGDPGKRDLLARSILSFGAEVKRFLPVLRDMQANETDKTVRNNLGRAITELEKR